MGLPNVKQHLRAVTFLLKLPDVYGFQYSAFYFLNFHNDESVYHSVEGLYVILTKSALKFSRPSPNV